MARWEPNARERIGKAAMELYAERGYDETSVADIAARAGLTERTFFRHFTDKREVLFGGSAELNDFMVAHVAAAPASMGPVDVVASALEGLSTVFADRRPFAQARRRIIAANPALQERELIKLASLAAAVAGALRQRGVPEPAATLAADSGMAIFKLAFERWLDDEKKRDVAHHVREAVAQLRAVTSEGRKAATPRTVRGKQSGTRRSARGS
jgi:AcrR family transcriptional regulator